MFYGSICFCLLLAPFLKSVKASAPLPLLLCLLAKLLLQLIAAKRNKIRINRKLIGIDFQVVGIIKLQVGVKVKDFYLMNYIMSGTKLLLVLLFPAVQNMNVPFVFKSLPLTLS